MRHPWKEIALTDYEAHMRLDTVAQLACLHEGMQNQLAYGKNTLMVLGIAGGNGLDLIDPSKIATIYGVDINEDYLAMCKHRYPQLTDIFQPLCLDLTNEWDQLPQAEELIANLLIEYIGYKAFQRVVRQVRAELVTCMIQIDTKEEFVSDSPYLASFDRLHEIHHPMQEHRLSKIMMKEGYRLIKQISYALPNGKELLQLDYQRCSL